MGGGGQSARRVERVTASGGLALAALCALADPRPQFPIELVGCEGQLALEQLSSALAVELNQPDPQVRALLLRAPPTARVRCSRHEVIITVLTPDGTAVETSQPLRMGLARFVAIAIAEAIAARATAQLSPAAPVVIREPPPAAPVTPEASEPLRLSARLGARYGGLPRVLGVDGAIGLDVPLWHALSLSGGLGLTHGGAAVEPGSFELTLCSAWLGARLGGSWGLLALEATLGFRGGLAVWSGRTRDPMLEARTLALPWLGAQAGVLVGFALTQRLRLDLETELGLPMVSSSALAGDVALASLRPFWVTARLGLSVRLGQ
jgi:hypothetical protein